MVIAVFSKRVGPAVEAQWSAGFQPALAYVA
jgi:hypothetical protein